MSHAFEEELLGLKLRGYALVPNDALETTIAVFTPEVAQSILSEHPEIVDRWLQKLHREYISKKKSCDFENDPVACFSLSVYEEFERHLKSWDDGGLIAITLPTKHAIRVTKKPLISFVNTATYVCDSCLAAFGSVKELVLHYRLDHPEMIEKVTIPI